MHNVESVRELVVAFVVTLGLLLVMPDAVYV